MLLEWHISPVQVASLQVAEGLGVGTALAVAAAAVLGSDG